MRTSQTHPLQIDSFPLAAGHVGMTLCPGRKGPSLDRQIWDRDLPTDIAALRAWGADIVVSLVDARELARLGTAGLGGAVEAAGMRWIHIPFADTHAPHDQWSLLWRDIAPQLHRALEQGRKVVIHCKAGLERTALVAALLQCERGETLAHAMNTITAVRKNAGLTGAQRHWLVTHLRADDLTKRRIRAALYGGAMGDILGAEIEFWSLARIRARFPDGVEPLTRDFTDDTQMTLFTAEGLLCGYRRGVERGIGSIAGPVHHAYLRWLETQGESAPLATYAFGLVTDPRLHQRRAPGHTCLSSLRAARAFGQPQRNTSKGCGALMRMVPLPLFWQGREAIGWARDISGLTHGHPSSADSCAVFTCICHALLADVPLEQAIRDAMALAMTEEVRGALTAALSAPRDGRGETVETLGGGWVADEALAIALYACLAAERLAPAGARVETALRIAVTHTGDADSTGAIAGNLLGLIEPEGVMAHRWRRAVNGADLIDRLAADLWFAQHPADYAARFHDHTAAPEGLWVAHHGDAYPGV